MTSHKLFERPFPIDLIKIYIDFLFAADLIDSETKNRHLREFGLEDVAVAAPPESKEDIPEEIVARVFPSYIFLPQRAKNAMDVKEQAAKDQEKAAVEVARGKAGEAGEAKERGKERESRLIYLPAKAANGIPKPKFRKIKIVLTITINGIKYKNKGVFKEPGWIHKKIYKGHLLNPSNGTYIPIDSDKHNELRAAGIILN